jgi:hypothetical protein
MDLVRIVCGAIEVLNNTISLQESFVVGPARDDYQAAPLRLIEGADM